MGVPRMSRSVVKWLLEEIDVRSRAASMSWMLLSIRNKTKISQEMEQINARQADFIDRSKISNNRLETVLNFYCFEKKNKGRISFV